MQNSSVVEVVYQPLTAAECEEFKNYVDNNFDKLLDELNWGTYGPDGVEPLKKRMLRDLETSHLENILMTQPHIGNLYRYVIMKLWQSRCLPSAG